MQTLYQRSTIARILRIASEVANQRGITKRDLVEKLEVSTRTLARDFEFLKDRIGLDIQCEIVPVPHSRFGIEYRYHAKNAAELLPVLELVNRFVL